MSASTPLLTDASRLSASQDVDNYAEGVSVHINGDWSQHYQFTIINQPWADSCGNHIAGSSRLRIPLTLNGIDYNVVVPIVPFAGATSGDAPSISQQPSTTSCGVGGSARFYVGAEGAPILLYQWYKNGNLLAGATSQQFAVTNVNLTNVDIRDCNIAGLRIDGVLITDLLNSRKA